MGSMKIRRTQLHGRRAWVAELGRINGRRRRKFYKTKEAAEAAVADAELQRKTAGDVWLSLSSGERLEAAQVITECRQRGVTLRDVWTEYLSASREAPAEVVTIADAVERYVEAKEANGNRPTYVSSLKGSLKAFTEGREEMPLHKVTLRDLEEHADKFLKPWSRRSAMHRVSSFLTYAVRRGWVAENLCRRMDEVRIDQAPPLILTPLQAARVMVATRRQYPDGLAYVSLALLAGVRPQEVQGVTWSDVNLDDGVVVISAAASKVALRRIVHLEPAALDWLKVAKAVKSVLPVNEAMMRKLLPILTRTLRFNEWPVDLLRHTAASYLLAEKRDAGLVAMELGNSVGVLYRHYRELVTRKDAARFWAMRPRRILAKMAKRKVGSGAGIEPATASL